MQVFIEQTGEHLKKNIFDKVTGAYSKTVDFHTTYPYPYGYILNTKASDGDALDCYVISDTKFQIGEVVECEPIGIVEYIEGDVPDHKILMVCKGDTQSEVSSEVKRNLLDFDAIFFQGRSRNGSRVGDFLGVDAAHSEIESALEK